VSPEGFFKGGCDPGAEVVLSIPLRPLRCIDLRAATFLGHPNCFLESFTICHVAHQVEEFRYVLNKLLRDSNGVNLLLVFRESDMLHKSFEGFAELCASKGELLMEFLRLHQLVNWIVVEGTCLGSACDCTPAATIVLAALLLESRKHGLLARAAAVGVHHHR